MSLFTRCLLLLLAFSLGPLVLVGAWVLRSDEMVKENVQAFHAQTVEQAAENLEMLASDINQSLRFALDLERAHAAGGADEFKVLQLAALGPQFSLLSLIGPDGKEYLRAADSRIFAAGVREDRSADPLVARARASGKVALGRVRVVRESPLMTIVYPLKGERCLYAEYALEGPWRRLRRQQIGKGGVLFVTDAQGNPHPGQEGVPAKAEGADLRGVLRETSGWLDLSSASWIGAYRKAPSLDWYVVSAQPRAQAYLRAEAFQLKLLIGLLLLALCVAAASAAVTRRLTDPLEDLIAGAARVCANDFRRPVREAGWGKIRELAAAFNRMMAKLREYQELQLDKILAEKAKIETLVGAIPDGIVMASLSGEPEYVNRLALRVLRLREPVPADKFRDVMNGLIRKSNAAELIALDEGGAVRRFKAKTILSSKSKGSDASVLVVLQDVTLEQELEKLKEEFLHAIVHDLRAPLSAIKGFAELIARPNVPAERIKTGLAHISKSCVVINDLVNDILDVAKLESGQVELAVSPVDADALVRDAVALFGPQAEREGKTLRAESASRLPAFAADRALLARVVTNLVGNAMKFTPSQGSITVRFGAVAEGPGAAWAEFAVADSGPGIPADKLEDIFGKFKQLAGEGAQRRGYGLGLSICKKIVELHGGRIWAESAPGRGASFIFRIPLVPA